MGNSSGRKRALILGGGFAGLAAALALRSDRLAVTLADRHPWLEFLPNIHELLSGVKTPELLRLPFENTLRRAGIGYDALIVALGGIDATRSVPGVVDHALPFESVEHCDPSASASIGWPGGAKPRAW